MNTSSSKPLEKNRAQGLVEFAIILPLLLMLILGIVEFGRLIFTYVITASASREGARFGSAVGQGMPQYRNCDGIRSATLRAGSLIGMTTADVAVGYDTGPSTGIFYTCKNTPGDIAPEDDPVTHHLLGNRVVVQAVSHFTPLFPQIVPFLNNLNITSQAARTIVVNVAAGAADVPPAPPTVAVRFVNPDGARQEGEPPLGVDLVLEPAAPQTTNTSFNFKFTPISGNPTLGTSGDFFVSGNSTCSSSSTSFSIPAGATSTRVFLCVVDDDINEDDEVVDIALDGVTTAGPSI